MQQREQAHGLRLRHDVQRDADGGRGEAEHDQHPRRALQIKPFDQHIDDDEVQ